MVANDPRQIAPAGLSIQQAADYVGVSRAALYRLLGDGSLLSLHIGRRRIVLKEHLDRYLQERLAAAGWR